MINALLGESETLDDDGDGDLYQAQDEVEGTINMVRSE